MSVDDAPRESPTGDRTGPPADGDWSLTFVDDFEGDGLDESKWGVGFGWGRGADHSEELIVEENVVVENSCLRLVQTDPNDGAPYHSGAVNTKKSFSQQFGYFETRARLPEGAGFESSFWGKCVDERWPPEIAVFEFRGGQPRSVELAANWTEHAEDFQDSTFHSGPVYTEDFHVFGVKWRREEVTWYVDGVPVWSLDPCEARHLDEDSPFYWMLSVHVGNYWSTFPDETTEFPASMDVDWVRAWERY